MLSKGGAARTRAAPAAQVLPGPGVALRKYVERTAREVECGHAPRAKNILCTYRTLSDRSRRLALAPPTPPAGAAPAAAGLGRSAPLTQSVG